MRHLEDNSQYINGQCILRYAQHQNTVMKLRGIGTLMGINVASDKCFARLLTKAIVFPTGTWNF